MKVIVASYPKCGTKTLHQCLEILGFSVHDFDSHSYYFGDEWMKMLNYGSDIELLRKMYRDVDCVCDVPACFYWEEIHKAFPDSKIVLTVRDEDDWIKSFNNQGKLLNASKLLKLYMTYTPTGRKVSAFWGRIAKVFMPFMLNPNEELQKMYFKAHNDAIIKRAPKDKLLTLNLSEGWKPLCEFLGKPIPDVPFPRENVGGKIVVDMFQLPLFVKMKREFHLFQAIFVLLISMLFLVFWNML